jgi:hypothetical protein
MLLITMREWSGPGRNMNPEMRSIWGSETDLRGFVTNLPLGEAIERIDKYSRAYGSRHIAAIEYRLVSITTIDDLTEEQIRMADTHLVEKLPQSVEDFDEPT